MAQGKNEAGWFDPIRRKQVAATPEEGVRQALLHYLLDTLAVPANLISVEFSLASIDRGNPRRADIVVWRPGQSLLVPWLLVECKEPRVPINDAVAFQAADYLRTVPCRYVMLSNGRDNRYLERIGEEYRLIAGLPYYKT